MLSSGCIDTFVYQMVEHNMFMYQMFERETRREKILEARHREMKLKQRTGSGQKQVTGGVEREYRAILTFTHLICFGCTSFGDFCMLTRHHVVL